VEWCVVGSFKASFIERDETVSSLQQVVSVFCFWWLVVDLPELTVSFFVSKFIDVTSEREHGITIFIEELGREI
jgi:hypothetical protein